MGFQLVIAEGKEAGREFTFDQPSVLIGRTPECDIILYDAGVSRKHARLFEEGGVHYLEDLGSSNGTLVNGARIEREPLRAGDAIALGAVVFTFSPVELDPATEAVAVGDEGDGPHTRIVTLGELRRSRNRGVAAVPDGASKEELSQLGVRRTTAIKALSGPRPAVPPATRPSSGRAAPLATRAEELPEGVQIAGGDLPPLARPSRPAVRPPTPALTAAERARMMRQGPAGLARLAWVQASRPARAAMVAMAGITAVALFAGAVALLAPPSTARAREPTTLTLEPVEASFGLGPGVTFERKDQKTFEFSVTSPVQVIAVLHYQSRGIESAREVSVTVNGLELGWLLVDLLDADERAHELLIPAGIIDRQAPNSVTFDAVNNPPGTDGWRVWNLWVETSVLPEMDEAGLIGTAEQRYEKAMQLWEQRDIGAGNRWEAYRGFREAWLTLEALPAPARPATYLLARDKMREARAELDLKCRTLLLEARTAFNLKQYDVARFALDHVEKFFPSRTHPCPLKADIDRASYEL